MTLTNFAGLWQTLLDFDFSRLVLTWACFSHQKWRWKDDPTIVGLCIYLSIYRSIYLFYPILFCSAIFYSIYLFYSILFHSILSIYLSTSLSHVILSVGPCFRSVQNQILGWKHITGRTMYGIQFGTTDFSSSIYVSMCLSIYLSIYLAI